MRELTGELISNFKGYLIEEEKSKATLEKYIRNIGTLFFAQSPYARVYRVYILTFCEFRGRIILVFYNISTA
jgi:hypothetical protein